MLKLTKILNFFIIPVSFYLVHVFLDIVFDIYAKFPNFANVMHFSGGIILAFTFFPLLNYLNKEGFLKLNRFMKFIFVISLIISVAVFWEFYEFVMDYFFNVNWQPSLADTMGDLFLGMTGGIIAGMIFFRKK
ncbi:hypothetical protein M0R19_00265 [Candidatus Pacearchaeota archaeon]|jgi:hypothetical protein|nr:hypothetical protein [Candidatus Pacearchaeota archaeon]